MRDNLLNNNYGRLTVIAGPDRRGKHTYWKCQCLCGTEKWVRGDQLKNGNTVSCGCKKTENLTYHGKDLKNQIFGNLIVLEPTSERVDGRIVWKCQCKCGNLYYTSSHNLLQGRVQSCGCLHSKGEIKIRNLLIANNIPFKEQQSFPDCQFQDTHYLAKFDFYIDNRYLIEYDGEQHFYYNTSAHTWNTLDNYKKVVEHDKYKNQWCKDHNILLIRIPYTHLDYLKIEDLLETSQYVVKENGN